MIDQEEKTESPDSGNSSIVEAPAIQFGVGGTQSMIQVVTSEILTELQKTNILKEWFGLPKDKVQKMLQQ